MKEYTELTEEIEKVYDNYSILSKETLIHKGLENVAFEKYISASQDKEKALTDIHLCISHQKMKIKLLNETLKKHNKEYELTLAKTKKVAMLLDGYEEKIKDIYALSNAYKSKIMY